MMWAWIDNPSKSHHVDHFRMQQSTLKVGENTRLTQQLTIAHKRVHYNASMNKAYDVSNKQPPLHTSTVEHLIIIIIIA